MTKNRLEAFSDGVLAIIITIMVLELKVPEETDWHALQHLIPIGLSYVLSFVFVGIYWNNHHHMLQATERISGGVLWANLHLLFWLSLVPFVTGWMGENHWEAAPTAAYGVVLLMAAVAYTILQRVICRIHDASAPIVLASRAGTKEWISLALYAAAISVAFANQYISHAMYATVALIWLVPDRRIESRLK